MYLQYIIKYFLQNYPIRGNDNLVRKDSNFLKGECYEFS